MLQKLLVCAAADNPAICNDEYLISIGDGRKPVGNDNDRLALYQPSYCLLNNRLVFRVDVGGRLVENDDRRVLQHGPGDGDPLPFPSGKMAMPIGRQDVNYLKIYVVSPLTAESKTVGAAVRYVTAMPGTYKLPEYGSTALRIDHSNYDYLDQEVALSLPGGDVECDLIDNGYDIRCEQRGGKLYIRLGGWFARRFELYLRSRESYTMVYVDVDVSL